MLALVSWQLVRLSLVLVVNVKINASGLKDKETAARLVAEANELIEKANEAEAEIMKIVEAKL